MFKKVSKLKLTFVFMVLFTLVGFSIYHVFEVKAALTPIKDSFIEPVGPAESQTMTIPVRGIAPAKPGVYWTQVDDGSFVATSTIDRQTNSKGTTSGGQDYPNDKVSFKAELDMSEYKPTTYKDSKDNPYPIAQIKHKGLDAGSSEYDYDGNNFEPTVSGSAPIIVSGENSIVKIDVKTGGDSWDTYDLISGSDTKKKVGYFIYMNLGWLGEVKQTKTIEVLSDQQLIPGQEYQPTATVETEDYQESPPTDVTYDSRVVWTTDNVGVTGDVQANNGHVTAGDLGTAKVTATFKSGMYELRKSITITVTEDPDNGEGESGYGRIVFTPDNTNGMEPPIVRNWARHDFVVTAKVVDYHRAEKTKSVHWTVKCTNAEKRTGRCPSSGIKDQGNSTYLCYRDKQDDIQITGSFTGVNNVVINKEGNNHKLNGRVGWGPKQSGWSGGSPPSRATYSTPSCELSPPDITGVSGIYKLDKTPPVQLVTPEKQSWTNKPITINIKHTDNLSGLFGALYDLKNISYYGQGGLTANGPTHILSWTPTLTINQQGVYTLKTMLGDYAGWPEVPVDGPQTYNFVDYRFDAIAPYAAEFQVGNGGVLTKDGIFDYVAGPDNIVQFKVGDDLSGVVNTQFAWSKSPVLGKLQNTWGNSWNDVPLTTPDYATGSNQMSYWASLAVDSHTDYFKDESGNYAGRKEGTWYLHIKQTDRAGNVTETVSPKIFINKVKNLRITGVADFKWKNTFKTKAGTPTNLAINGIGPNEMAVYSTVPGDKISLGYGVNYKFDSVGFDGVDDQIVLKLDYHVLTDDGKTHDFTSVYTEDKNGDFVPLSAGDYGGEADLVVYDAKYNANRKEGYESAIKWNTPTKDLYELDSLPETYSTYANRTFLPATTKFMDKGAKFNSTKDKGLKGSVLVTFTLEAHRVDHKDPLMYTLLEDQWAVDNVWNTNQYNSYGKNKQSGRDLLGLGVGSGEAFWLNLNHTQKDDLKYYREW